MSAYPSKNNYAERLVTTLVLNSDYAVIRHYEEPHTIYACAENPKEIFDLAEDMIKGWNLSAEIIPVKAKVMRESKYRVTFQLLDFEAEAQSAGYTLKRYLALREKVDYCLADLRKSGRMAAWATHNLLRRQKSVEQNWRGTRIGLLVSAETFTCIANSDAYLFWLGLTHRDMIEAIVKLPSNTETNSPQYAVILTNNKAPARKDLVQFIDAQILASATGELSEKQIWEVATLWHAQTCEGPSVMMPGVKALSLLFDTANRH